MNSFNCCSMNQNPTCSLFYL